MKNFKEWVLIGQYGGQKWVVGDYDTEKEALNTMNMKFEKDTKRRKGKPGPPLTITILKFYAVYRADQKHNRHAPGGSGESKRTGVILAVRRKG